MHFPAKSVFLIILLLFGNETFSAQNKYFICFSLKSARVLIEKELTTGSKRNPEAYYLSAITIPWAILNDTINDDIILVGERDSAKSPLNLDDFVVALRARANYPDEDPGVSIDPLPKTSCVLYQNIKFFAGIRNTAFGRECFEADWSMKRLGMKIDSAGIEGFETYYDAVKKSISKAKTDTPSVQSRFWFFPITNRVNISGNIGIIESFKMGVFTEVLSAVINGKTLSGNQLKEFEHYPSIAFAQAFTKNYEFLSKKNIHYNKIRGLSRLAALTKALFQMQTGSKLAYWLRSYILPNITTKDTIGLLNVIDHDLGFSISGGVILASISLRLKEGDANALVEAIIASRPSAKALSWSFAWTGENLIIPNNSREEIPDSVRSGY